MLNDLEYAQNMRGICANEAGEGASAASVRICAYSPIGDGGNMRLNGAHTPEALRIFAPRSRFKCAEYAHVNAHVPQHLKPVHLSGHALAEARRAAGIPHMTQEFAHAAD